MNRRKLIATVGAGTVVAVAGCSDGGSSGGGGGNNADTSSPTAVVESWYEKSNELGQDASTDEVLDAIDPFLHSVSPIPDALREAEDSNNESEDRSLDNISTEVIEENVDENTLNNEFSLSFFNVSEDDVATIAEENAIVEGQISYDNGDEQQVQHITAPENGDWLLVL
jgi:hypothetical protein